LHSGRLYRIILGNVPGHAARGPAQIAISDLIMNKFHQRIPPLATLFTALLLFIGCSQAAGPSLSPTEALDEVKAGKITLIDVRTPMEWRQSGVAPMAHRIDIQDPNGTEGFVEKVLADVKGDKTAPIALICRTGNRSSYAQRELMAKGFTNVINVQEGMGGSGVGPGWIKRGLPVKPCPDC
jgi:rhodanese-related sulfurtransferase